MMRRKFRAKNRDQIGSLFGHYLVTPKHAKTSEFCRFCGSKGEIWSFGHYIYMTIDQISVEQVRQWLLTVLDAVDTITNQARARRVRGYVWQLNHILGRAAIDQGFWERCGEVLTQVSGWLIVGRPYPAGVAKGYRYLLDRCIADVPALPPEAQEAAQLCIEIGELLYLELISDTNQDDQCHH
jgi:hypothetical protein